MAVHGGFVDGPAASGGFREEDHPRDAKGEFAGKGGTKDAGKGENKSNAGGQSAQSKPTVVDASPSTRTAVKEFFGREVSDQELQGLLGALDGAHVAVDAGSGGSLIFHVQHDLYAQPHIAYAVSLPWGGKMMQLELYHLKDSAPQGMGTNAFASMVEGARSLGLEAIHIPIAARTNGTPKMVGYYVWPRLGADGKIPNELRSSLPESLKDAQNLSDLMKSGEGKAWWKANGQTVSCTFLTDPASVSSQVLGAYLSEKKGKTVN